MAISFPTTGLTPNVTTYTYSGRTWLWTGTVWQSVGTVTGAQGLQGVQGVQGIQGGVTNAPAFTVTEFTATSGQTTFSVTYNVGYINVFVNGVKLGSADYTATNGTSVVLSVGAVTGDLVTVQYWTLGLGAQGVTGAQGTQGTQGTTYSAPTLGTTVVTSGTTISTIAGLTLTSPTETNPYVTSPKEVTTVSGTAITATQNFDALTQGVLYVTASATSNFTLNFRGSSTVTLNNSMAVGASQTVSLLSTNGSTAYYPSAFQIDGTSVTPKWSGGTAPSAGNASAIDAYQFTIIKTSSTPTYTVLAAGPIKYA